VQSKKLWIFEKTKHKQKYRELPHPPGKELVSGESALYLGRQYRIEMVKDGLKEIKFDHRFMVPASHVSQRKDAMRDWYIARAQEKILPRVEHHARNLGVEFKQAKIVDSRYRWGSCTMQDNVNFNWRLIKAPMFVIDYVIVHELAHLIEANHTTDFWNIVRTQTPTTDTARLWLKENGQILEEDI
jgi:predicted metal-dependent hydrolase